MLSQVHSCRKIARVTGAILGFASHEREDGVVVSIPEPDASQQQTAKPEVEKPETKKSATDKPAIDKPSSDDPSELQKLQFDYAWKWFNFHGDQRIKMFNFMLLVFGIFAAGVVNALNHVSHYVTAILCFTAACIAPIFGRLDRRNRDLVWFGEDVLMHLERERIFGKDVKIKGRHGEDIHFGILMRQLSEDNEMRQVLGDRCCGRIQMLVRDAWLGKHRFWLPTISRLIAVLFLLAGILIWNFGPALTELSGPKASANSSSASGATRPATPQPAARTTTQPAAPQPAPPQPAAPQPAAPAKP